MTALLGSADAELHPTRPWARSDRFWRWAPVAAALLHLTVILLFELDWNGLFSRPIAPEPEPIPVALVFQPPPAPPAPPPPPPVPAEPPSRLAPKSSGTEAKTEAEKIDKPVPALPPARLEPEPQQPRHAGAAHTPEKPTPPAPPEAKPSPRAAAVIPAPPKEPPRGEIFHAIRLPSRSGGTGSETHTGDPYLNELRDIVERNRIYPPASAFPGGGERVAVYSILVDPSGELAALTLLQSTGLPLLDQAAGRMIRASVPFPPFPPSFAQIRTLITVEIPIFPRPR